MLKLSAVTFVNAIMNGLSVFFFVAVCGFPLVKLQKNAPSKEKRLQADLFRDYDPFLSPNPGNRTEVRTGILLGNYEYMEGSLEMAIQGFIKMSWFDERLVWNVSETGVTGFVPEQDIWRPHLVEIKNRGFDGEPIYHTHGKKERNFNSEIQSTIVRNGDITSVHTIRLTAKCVADLKEWPRDRATCEAFIGAQAIQNINLTSYHDEYIFSSYMESEMEDWMLTNISEKKLDLKTPQNGFDQILSITLELQTTGNILTRLLIYPGLASAAVTLALLVLRFDNSIRLFTLVFSFIIHTYLLQILAFHMPDCGADSPYLVKYFVNSIIIIGLIMVETIVVRSISSIKQMSTSVVMLLRYLETFKIFDLLIIRRHQIINGISLQEQSSQDESPAKIRSKEKSWDLIAFLIDRLMLCAVILAYSFNIVHFLVY